MKKIWLISILFFAASFAQADDKDIKINFDQIDYCIGDNNIDTTYEITFYEISDISAQSGKQFRMTIQEEEGIGSEQTGRVIDTQDYIVSDRSRLTQEMYNGHSKRFEHIAVEDTKVTSDLSKATDIRITFEKSDLSAKRIRLTKPKKRGEGTYTLSIKCYYREMNRE